MQPADVVAERVGPLVLRRIRALHDQVVLVVGVGHLRDALGVVGVGKRLGVLVGPVESGGVLRPVGFVSHRLHHKSYYRLQVKDILL